MSADMEEIDYHNRRRIEMSEVKIGEQIDAGLDLEAQAYTSMVKSGMKHERNMIVAEIRALDIASVVIAANKRWKKSDNTLLDCMKEEIADRIKASDT